MIPNATHYLNTRKGYLLITAMMGLLGVAAREWTPDPCIRVIEFYGPFGWQNIHVDAWAETASGYEGYWTSEGTNVSCSINVEDLDTWTDGYESDTAADTINWNNVLWTQTNGNWQGCSGTGASVTWRPNDDAEFGWINVIQLDDDGLIPNGDIGSRKDGPENENACVLIEVFKVLGTEDIWYWGNESNTDVDSNYVREASYSARLVNYQGAYRWTALGALRVKNTFVNPPTWDTAIEGVGLISVNVKAVENGSGSVVCNYLTGGLYATKLLKMHRPASCIDINWAQYSDDLLSYFGEYDAQRHVGRNYDENIYTVPGHDGDGNGYMTLIGYHLRDTFNENVPYWYAAQEYFTNTNGGQGFTLLAGETWAWQCNDNQWRSRGQTIYNEGFLGPNVWVDSVGALDGYDLSPHAQTPNLPARIGTGIHYGYGIWHFGKDEDCNSDVFTFPRTWRYNIDCGGHL